MRSEHLKAFVNTESLVQWVVGPRTWRLNIAASGSRGDLRSSSLDVMMPANWQWLLVGLLLLIPHHSGAASKRGNDTH